MRITADLRNRSPKTQSGASAELRGRILKLRWIGMEDEALELSEKLADEAALDCPLIEPRDTD